MNIGAVPYQAFPSIGYAIKMSQHGKMFLPVQPAAFIYSQFKHVSGVLAPEGVQGVTINKLAIIDTLIEQVSKMDKRPTFYAIMEDQGTETRTDALIAQYQDQVRSIQAASAGTPYAPDPPLLGAVFSIRA
jgi:hypothetical protein